MILPVRMWSSTHSKDRYPEARQEVRCPMGQHLRRCRSCELLSAIYNRIFCYYRFLCQHAVHCQEREPQYCLQPEHQPQLLQDRRLS